MSTDLVDAAAVAAVLDAAHLDGHSLDVGAIAVGDLASAYTVQRELTELRLSRGDAVVGWKLGYTTRAMRDQMKIDAPNLGPLLASMRVEGGVVTGIHPRVEPEIAFVMAEDPGPDPTPDAVLARVAEARLALEVVDSVWSGYRFDLEHNTADGSSAHGFVLGPVLPDGTGRLEVEITRTPSKGGAVPSGRVETSTERLAGVGDLRDAAASVAWLCRELAACGRRLRPGDVLLTGGLTAALPLPEGTVVRANLVGSDERVEVGR